MSTGGIPLIYMPQREMNRGRKNSTIVLQCLMSPLHRRFRKCSEIMVGLSLGASCWEGLCPGKEAWSILACGWTLRLES